jgi:hypothetical protein
MKLFKFLRTPSITNNTLISTTRGPKKKSDKKDMVKSEHILNFYKNSDDVPILPNEYYPKWVLDLSKFRYNYKEYLDNTYYGHRVNNH